MTNNTPQADDDDAVAALLTQLRAEGYGAYADRLETVRYHTAWTTGTELLGELGRVVRDFQRSRPVMSRELRRRVKTCERIIRRAWPCLFWPWSC